MRRQTELGGHSAGSSRIARLDPLALPLRFTANDAVADGRVRHVELHRERVILRRAVQGMRVALNVPVTAFRGVAVRLIAASADEPARAAVVLEHCDPALSIELFAAPDSTDVVAEWQLWSRVLSLPPLFADADGNFSEPFPRLGAMRVKAPTARRRRRSPLAKRRPRFLARRRMSPKRDTAVYRGEREIIARN